MITVKARPDVCFLGGVLLGACSHVRSLGKRWAGQRIHAQPSGDTFLSQEHARPTSVSFDGTVSSGGRSPTNCISEPTGAQSCSGTNGGWLEAIQDRLHLRGSAEG